MEKLKRLRDKILLVNLPLQKRLVFFFVFFIILSVVFVFTISYSIYTNLYQEKLFDSNRDTVKNVGILLDEKLQPYLALTIQMAINEDVQTILKRTKYYIDDEAEAYNNINEVVGNLVYIPYSEDLVSMVLYGNDKKYVFGQYDKSLDNYGYIYRELKSTKNGVIIIDTKRYNFLSGRVADCIGIARIIKDNDGSELGFVVVLIKSDFFSHVINTMKFNEDSFFYVLSDKGSLLFSNAENSQAEGIVREHFNHIDQYNRYDRIIRIGGNKYQVPLYHMEKNGWIVVNLIPYVFERSLIVSRFIIILSSTFFAIVAVAVAISIAFDISNPISGLISVMRNIGNGDFSIRAPETKGKEMRELYNYFNNMIEQIKQLMETDKKNQEALLKSELATLQAQINPHFLYNTLNSIRWMAIINGQNQIKTLVDGLSKLLMDTFKMNGEFITLDDELHILRSYVDVMKVRYRNFDMSFNIDEELLPTKVMKFMLQPIVENSIIHGFKDIKWIGEINISALREGGDMVIMVKDNGVGIPAEKIDEIINEESRGDDKFTHIGVNNVHKRIQLRFGADYGVDIGINEPTGTVVTVRTKIIA